MIEEKQIEEKQIEEIPQWLKDQVQDLFNIIAEKETQLVALRLQINRLNRETQKRGKKDCQINS